MNPDALLQARSRLKKAEKALAAFRAAEEIESAEEAWSDFLLAASTIYSKLEQGAKGYQKSEPWFGKKKKERKDDPLLRYLHFARNSDEHGIERVSATTPPNFHGLTGRPLKFNERAPLKVMRADPVTKMPVGEPINAVIAGPILKPISAHDRRYNDWCNPPQTHRGNHIPYSGFVDFLAEAALPYLREMIEEAAQLPSNDSKRIAK